jgi:hypothetical protein
MFTSSCHRDSDTPTSGSNPVWAFPGRPATRIGLKPRVRRAANVARVQTVTYR